MSDAADYRGTQPSAAVAYRHSMECGPGGQERHIRCGQSSGAHIRLQDRSMSAAFRSRYWSHWIKPVTMNCFEYLEAPTRSLAPTITREMSLFVLGGRIQGGVGEEKAVATARDFTHVPGATRHGFKVCGGRR